MKPLVVHPEAEAELQVAADYYEERVAGLGTEFLEEIGDLPFCSRVYSQRFVFFTMASLERRRHSLAEIQYDVLNLERRVTR